MHLKESISAIALFTLKHILNLAKNYAENLVMKSEANQCTGRKLKLTLKNTEEKASALE